MHVVSSTTTTLSGMLVIERWASPPSRRAESAVSAPGISRTSASQTVSMSTRRPPAPMVGSRCDASGRRHQLQGSRRHAPEAAHRVLGEGHGLVGGRPDVLEVDEDLEGAARVVVAHPGRVVDAGETVGGGPGRARPPLQKQGVLGEGGERWRNLDRAAGPQDDEPAFGQRLQRRVQPGGRNSLCEEEFARRPGYADHRQVDPRRVVVRGLQPGERARVGFRLAPGWGGYFRYVRHWTVPPLNAAGPELLAEFRH